MREITWKDLSRYRGELMGAAIIFIVLFHAPLARADAFFGLRRCGNIGVDMFLFLSGIGLWYSWVKTPSFKQFYKRRLLRIFLRGSSCHHSIIFPASTDRQAVSST